VPLYQIQQGGVSVPIGLNYVSTGVKANDVASNVGLNWSLDAGGAITKIIKGFEDFSVGFNGPFRDEFGDEVGEGLHYECDIETLCQAERKLKYDDFIRPKDIFYKLGNINQPRIQAPLVGSLGWFVNTQSLSLQTFFGYESSPYPDRVIELGNLNYNNIKQDTHPDLFYVNAPGLSTKFTHRKDRTPFEIEYQGNTIETTVGKSNVIPFLSVFENKDLHPYIVNYYGSKPRKLTCVNSIDITNTAGINYQFNVLDVNQYATRGASLGVANSDPAHLTSQEVTTYHLNEIKDLNGDVIQFEYETYKKEKRRYSKSQSFILGRDDKLFYNGLPSITEVFYPQLHKIKKITHKQGTIHFEYLHNRRDLTTDKALTNIIIKNNLGQIVKKFNFTYDYFVANTNCNDANCLRLKLKRITEESRDGQILPPYRFFYDETQLPELGTTTVDYLGYANGIKDSYESDRTTSNFIRPPSLYFSYGKKRLSIAPFKIFNNSYKISGRDFTPSLKYTQAGSLLRIQKPTGANQYFTYELNSFSTDEVKNVTAGGLRIKEQSVVDEKGHIKLLERYFYEDENGYSSGVINNLPSFGDVNVHASYDGSLDVAQGINNGSLVFRLYSSTKGEIKLVNGNNISYSRVIVKNGINNGTVERTYSTVKEYPIEEPTFDEDFYRDKDLARAMENGGHFSYFNNKDVLLGKLLTEKVKDVEGNIVEEKEFTYKYNLFEEMESVVKVSPSSIINISSEAAVLTYELYNKVFSHRNLETTVKSSTIYENGEIKNTSEYTYDPNFPFITESRTKLDGQEEIHIKKFYPHNVTSQNSLSKKSLSVEAFNTIEKLKTKGRFSTSIQDESYRDNKLLSTQRINFKDWGNDILAPEIVEIAKSNDTLRKGVKQQYDVYGNMVEISREKGNFVTYIYGYNNTLPIAKIDGAKLSDVPNTLIEAIKDASNQDNDRTVDVINTEGNRTSYIGKEGKLREELAKLYVLSSLHKANISTYTYDPLIGVTSMTDARQQTVYYDYDTFNRVRFIKNYKGEILTQYCYNYKGEKRNCNNTTDPDTDTGEDIVVTPDDIESSINNVFLNVYQPKEYLIPIPATNQLAFTWSAIEDYIYPENNSLHPFFHAPPPYTRHSHHTLPEPNSILELDSSFYTLNEYFDNGYYKAYRKGYAFSIEGIENLNKMSCTQYSNQNPLPGTDPEICRVIVDNSEDNLEYNYYIISEGKIYNLVQTPEIKTVFFIPECLKDKTGQVVCLITRKITPANTSNYVATIVSRSIKFEVGFTTNDDNTMCIEKEEILGISNLRKQ